MQPEGRYSAPFQEFWRRFRRHKAAVAGAIITLLICLVAVSGPWVTTNDPFKIDLRKRLKPPSADHLFGNDVMGRDIFSRVVHGARTSLGVGVVSVAVGSVIGIVVGGITAYLGGWYDEAASRALDVILAFPAILLGLAIVAVLGPSIWNVAVAVGLVSVPRFARVIRSAVLGLKEREFVMGAVAIGSNHPRVFFQHILPNCVAPVLVMTTLYMGTSLIMAASLSFLGMGVQPPTPEWGNMLAEARDFITSAPHVAVFPGLALTITAIGLNLLGDGLRDALDPKLK